MAPNNETIRQRLHLLESYVRQLYRYRQRTLAEVLDDTGLVMARFRNILVHVYAQVDVRRVYENLQNHLDDFGQFAQYVWRFLAQQTDAQGDVTTGSG
jgi:hypothetical protein